MNNNYKKNKQTHKQNKPQTCCTKTAHDPQIRTSPVIKTLRTAEKTDLRLLSSPSLSIWELSSSWIWRLQGNRFLWLWLLEWGPHTSGFSSSTPKHTFYPVLGQCHILAHSKAKQISPFTSTWFLKKAPTSDSPNYVAAPAGPHPLSLWFPSSLFFEASKAITAWIPPKEISLLWCAQWVNWQMYLMQQMSTCIFG